MSQIHRPVVSMRAARNLAEAELRRTAGYLASPPTEDAETDWTDEKATVDGLLGELAEWQDPLNRLRWNEPIPESAIQVCQRVIEFFGALDIMSATETTRFIKPQHDIEDHLRLARRPLGPDSR